MTGSTSEEQLDDVQALLGLLKARHKELFEDTKPIQRGRLRCAPCGSMQRMSVKVEASPMIGIQTRFIGLSADQYLQRLLPTTLSYECLNCGSTASVLIYDGPDGLSMAIFPRAYGGLTTPHTPHSIAYYLDQAQRSQAAGAYSAATAMYRSALEHLLHEQGYSNGMLHNKLQALVQDIEQGAPTAARFQGLDTEFLTVIKDLGNGAIHTNAGDISRQGALDRELVQLVGEAFAYLLFHVYEAPHQRQAHLEALRVRAQRLRR